MRAKQLLKRYAAGERKFSDADLSGADLRGADLSNAEFENSTFNGANLSRANLANTAISETDLCEASFVDTNFWGAQLTGLNMNQSDLRRAAFYYTRFHSVGLRSANLQGAQLWLASLFDVEFTGADIRKAEFLSAQMRKVTFKDAKCDGVILGGVLANVDLTPLCKAQNVCHKFPSTIDWTSVACSLRAPRLKEFLIASGMPPIFVEFMVETAHAHEGNALFSMMQSTFISYGGPDERFARKLYEALQSSGVTTFFFAEHAVPGKKLHRTMRQGVNSYDRVILICSKASLNRPGVLNEIEETLARESRDGGAEYLIPIRLDNYLFDGWNPPNRDVAQTIKDRVVADFRGAKTSQAKFDAQLIRLLAALKKNRPISAALDAAAPDGAAS